MEFLFCWRWALRLSVLPLWLIAFSVAVQAGGSAEAMAGYARVSEDGRGAVATVHPLASQAAIDAYAEGGTAIDAAVAAALTLGVVDSHNSGIGGGSFMLVRWADGRVEAIDAREMAPAAASRDMYLREGKAVAELSRVGALAPGIPGSVAGFEYLLKRGGKRSFAQLLLPAADLAERGFAIDKIFAGRIARHQQRLQRFSGSAAILLDKQGQPWPVGHRLIQKDLAHSYRQLAKHGSDYFYRGDFARLVGEWMAANGGIITAKDFADYQLKIRQPLLSRYRGYQIYGFPPPSSGGIHVAQILNILQGFDLAALSEVDRYHLLGEAMKLAFADRAYWLGDSDFAKVPKGLVSEKYAQQLRAQIDLKTATAVASHGVPEASDTDLFGKHTTHIATADKEGNWVAITTTVNTNFGSKVIVPGTGVILNNQMDDFSAQPGAANAFGLVGAEANSIAPGKRPLSSMSPTLVVQDGKPMMTLGAAGGPTIITQVVQALVNHLDLKQPLNQALATKRVHQQWKPEWLFVEADMAPAVRKGLQAKGHSLKNMGPYGSTQAIALDAKGEFISVSEPRLLLRNR